MTSPAPALPVSHEIARKGAASEAHPDAPLSVTLSYEDRFLRRKVLKSDQGESFLVDLAHTESLDEGDAFVLTDGRAVRVAAAAEPLLAVSGARPCRASHGTSATVTRLARSKPRGC